VKKARSLSTPFSADEGKGARPLSRAVAALRPCHAAGFLQTIDNLIYAGYHPAIGDAAQ
jgi:hypothetical protein